MEYKICENCGAKLHVRTLKCPICNVLLTDASKIINDENVTEKVLEKSIYIIEGIPKNEHAMFIKKILKACCLKTADV